MLHITFYHVFLCPHSTASEYLDQRVLNFL